MGAVEIRPKAERGRLGKRREEGKESEATARGGRKNWDGNAGGVHSSKDWGGCHASAKVGGEKKRDVKNGQVEADEEEDGETVRRYGGDCKEKKKGEVTSSYW